LSGLSIPWFPLVEAGNGFSHLLPPPFLAKAPPVPSFEFRASLCRGLRFGFFFLRSAIDIATITGLKVSATVLNSFFAP